MNTGCDDTNHDIRPCCRAYLSASRTSLRGGPPPPRDRKRFWRRIIAAIATGIVPGFPRGPLSCPSSAPQHSFGLGLRPWRGSVRRVLYNWTAHSTIVTTPPPPPLHPKAFIKYLTQSPRNRDMFAFFPFRRGTVFATVNNASEGRGRARAN